MNLNNMVQFCSEFGLPDPLSGINVPDPIDPGLVRSAIMVRCGLLTPVYGEPEVFTAQVTDWFTEKQWTFEHLVNILKAKYSPIENVDRYEDIKTGRNGKTTDVHSGKDNRHFTAADSDTNSGTDTTENTISAENASTYQPDNKRTTTNGLKTDYVKDQSTDDTYGHTITRTDDGDETRIAHLHGNVGVTSNVQLIEEELRLLDTFDPYKWIAAQFETEFMLMLY